MFYLDMYLSYIIASPGYRLDKEFLQVYCLAYKLLYGGKGCINWSVALGC